MWAGDRRAIAALPISQRPYNASMPCTVLIVVALLVAVLLSGVSLLAVKMQRARLVDVSKRAAAELGLQWRNGPLGFELEGDFHGAHVLFTHVEEIVTRAGEERVIHLPVLVAETTHDETTAREALPGAEIVDGRVRVAVRDELADPDDYARLLAAATGRSERPAQN